MDEFWNLGFGNWNLGISKFYPGKEGSTISIRVSEIKCGAYQVTMAIILQDTPNLARGLLPGGARG
jgi:hypothetical protein